MRSKVVPISLPKPLLDEIDKVAGNESRSRSEFFRQAARSYLVTRKKLDALYEYGQTQANKLGIKTEEDIEKLIGDVRAGR